MAKVQLTDEKSVRIEGKRLKILEALSLDAMIQANSSGSSRKMVYLK